MILSAVVVVLLLAGLIVPVVFARQGRALQFSGPSRRPRTPKPPKPVNRPPLRLVVRPDDMDGELKKLLEEDRR